MLDGQAYAAVLTRRVDAVRSETKEALETILAELNRGQRMKIVNNAKVAELLERYGVSADESRDGY